MPEYIKNIKKHFIKRKKIIVRGIVEAKKDRDSALSASESHSDTTRYQKDKIISALERDLVQLETLIAMIPLMQQSEGDGLLWKAYESEDDSSKQKYILVPDGMGGESIDGYFLLSVNSNLGKLIYEKGEGNHIFNQKKLVIKKVPVI